MRFPNPVPGTILPLGAQRPPGQFAVTRDCAGHRATNQGCALDLGNGRCDGRVLSVGNGRVVYVDPTQGIVRIDHGTAEGHRWRSDYAHMVPILVKLGQAVQVGQQIGEVGDAHSPSVTNFAGCHLHFAIVRDGQEVDPWPLLAQNQESNVFINKGFAHVVNRRTTTTVNARFRADATRQSDTITIMPAGTTVLPVFEVQGEDIGGNPRWYGAFNWIEGSGYVLGFYHSSVLGELQASESADCGPAIQKATLELTNRLERKNTALDSADQAIKAARTV